MTTRTRRLLFVLAASALALRASAHEVDCSKLAAIALRDPHGGGPILDPDGLPSLAAPPSVALTVDHYPALVAFDLEIRNLASEPSVISTVSDTLLPDPARILSFGDVLGGTIPVGGRLHRVLTVAVRSFDDCLATFPLDRVNEPVCGLARENTLLVTTESDIAACRAHVLCAPQVVGLPPPRSPPPSVCTGPTWTGVLQAPLLGIDFAWADTVGCDGATWLAGSVFDPFVVTSDVGAVIRIDPAGELSLFHLDDTANAVRVDGNGFLDVASHRRVGNQFGAGATVRQLDPVGTPRWEYDAPDFVVPPLSAPSGAIDADIDGSSNVYFAYRTTAPARGSEIAVVKLTPDGAVVWTSQLGTDADDELGHIAVAPDGALFVAGTTRGTFPGQTSAGGQDAFLAQLDPTDGHLVWVRQLGTAGPDFGAAVAVDPRDGGPVALAGTTAGPLDGGAPAPATDAYVALFDRAGTLQWIHELRATPSEPPVPPSVTGNAVAIDQAGAVWLGGSAFAGSIPGGSSSLTLGADAIIARYDASGAYLWGRHFSEGSDTQVTHLAIDASGSGVASVNAREGLSRRAIFAIRLSPDGT